jgi:hypothetical protein
MGDLLEFTAAGSPEALSRAIEEYARGQGTVTAIVVPWESQGDTLSMAVTSAKTDGWAIEHTNLGTIRVTGLGDEKSRVAIVPEAPRHPDQARLAAVFDRFARELQGRFAVAPST